MSEFSSIHSLAQTITAGTTLFEEGTVGGGMIILLTGSLDVFRGGTKVGVISEPGSYVGEATVLTGKTRSATVVAESSVTIIRLSSSQALAFLDATGAEEKVVRNMSERLESANDQLVEKTAKIASHREAMTELLDGLKSLYVEMDQSASDAAAFATAMKQVRLLVNNYGTGRFTKGRIQV